MTLEKKWLALAVLALLLGIAIGYGVSRLGGSDALAPLTKTEDRRILYWHDPMKPEHRFDKPGKSPFMDMDLVPVYADEQTSAAVQIDPGIAQNLGIRLGRVERSVVPVSLAMVGSVSFDERLVEVVQARVEGYVTRLHVKSILTPVRRGQPIAEIVAPAWLEAQQDYIALLDVDGDRAKAIRAAARERLTILGVPEATILALEKQRKADASTTIHAPIDGVVTELAIRAGSTFMPGAALVRINGMATLWVNARVPEAQVSLISEGVRGEVRAMAWPDVTFTGRVISLLPDVDPQTRTLTARVEIENRERKLSPGMFVSLRFEPPQASPQLVVPSEAVIRTGTRDVVIVAREQGGFDVAEVNIGAERGGLTTILSGLEIDQSVVLSGQFLIDSEASLKSTLDRLGASP
jgi:membrane fusion protein, copper/silver efflux system